MKDTCLLPLYQRYYRSPLVILRGRMQYVYDNKGKRYLDAFAGVVSISCGHCHKDIIEPVKKQLSVLQHASSLYPHPLLERYARALSGIAPRGLSRSFITNSGTEANELAVLIAKRHTGRQEFIALGHSFHGRTSMSMSLTGQARWKQGTGCATVVHAPAPYCYRCPLKKSYPGCDIACAQFIEEQILTSTSACLSAFIAEPILGLGGVIVPPPEYFKCVHAIIKKYRGLFISDEVQTGFGRLARSWFGIEQWKVVPDIITMAKGMGNGFPIGGVIATERIARTLKGMSHFSTFGGNPVACLQGSLVIKTIMRHRYMENALRRGDELLAGLAELKKRHSIVGEVRGMGLMLGVECVRDPGTREPATDEVAEIMETAKDKGVLVGRGGLWNQVIRITPPYCLNRKDVSRILNVLDEALTKVGRKRRGR